MNKLIISLETARDVLRLDGPDNDEIILPLIESIPSYLETTTGKSWIDDDEVHPLAQTAAKFILQLWYNPKDKNTEQLQRTIENLLSTLQALGRKA